MKTIRTVAGIVGALALTASPALAIKGGTPPSNQGTAHKQVQAKANTPGPKASLPAKANAYGRYCQGQSKLQVAGTKGTPFSRCVTAMAKVAHHQATAKSACKGESRKKAAGASKSSFSMCVAGAARLKHDQAKSNP